MAFTFCKVLRNTLFQVVYPETGMPCLRFMTLCDEVRRESAYGTGADLVRWRTERIRTSAEAQTDMHAATQAKALQTSNIIRSAWPPRAAAVPQRQQSFCEHGSQPALGGQMPLPPPPRTTFNRSWGVATTGRTRSLPQEPRDAVGLSARDPTASSGHATACAPHRRQP